MALNLSKLKNTVQPENNTNKTNFSKLNLSGLKKQAEYYKSNWAESSRRKNKQRKGFAAIWQW